MFFSVVLVSCSDKNVYDSVDILVADQSISVPVPFQIETLCKVADFGLHHQTNQTCSRMLIRLHFMRRNENDRRFTCAVVSKALVSIDYYQRNI